MSEKYKIFDSEKPYFVTFSIVRWIELFNNPEYTDILIESIKYCQENKGLEVFGYCIMPSHVHLIIRSEHEKLSAIVRDMKKYTANRIIKLMKQQNESREILSVFAEEGAKVKRNTFYKIWQDGYHPEEISSNKFFDQKLNYIHNNPVESGIVNKPEHYLYSSARNYAELDSVIEIIIESSKWITY